MSVVEKYPLHGGVIHCFTVFWDKNFFVRCSEVSVVQRCPLMEVPQHSVPVFYVFFSDKPLPFKPKS